MIIYIFYTDMDKNTDMKDILMEAPDGTNEETVKELYIKHENNKQKVIDELWNGVAEIDVLRKILQQAPEEITLKTVQIMYYKYDNDIVNVLSSLWNIADIKNVEYNEDKEKWKGIREICNAYEEEMERFMQHQRSHL
jgi:hypothetical protein